LTGAPATRGERATLARALIARRSALRARALAALLARMVIPDVADARSAPIQTWTTARRRFFLWQCSEKVGARSAEPKSLKAFVIR